ncbi:MAG: LptF/LptG family permease [Candidatus Eremiobacterota bacterium]
MTFNLKNSIIFKKNILNLTLIDRYIVNELTGPFFFGLSAFTLLYVSCGLFFQMAKLITEADASVGVAMKFLLNSLPQILIFTLPMSILLASLLAFGRLSSDCEIIAFRAHGISLYRLIIPVVIMAFALTVVSLLFNEFIVPNSSYEARKIVVDVLARQKLQEMSSNLVIRDTSEDGIERIIYAKKYSLKEGIMEDVTVQEYIGGGSLPVRSTFAHKALWEYNSWSLIEGKTYSYDEDGKVNSLISFKRTTMSVNKSPMDISNTQKFPEEMNSREIKERIDRDRKMNLDYHWLEVQYHAKFSAPFACVVFAMIGVPFGLRPHRSSSSVGFGVSLVIIFFYYIMMVTFATIGNFNVLPPFIACWMPNIIFGAVGFYLIKKAAG